jgi:hypothetical protein
MLAVRCTVRRAMSVRIADEIAAHPVRPAVAAAMRSPPAQARQSLRDGLGRVGIVSAHAFDFTCDLTCIQNACHTTCTCKVTSKGLLP